MKTSKILFLFWVSTVVVRAQSPCIGFSATKYYQGDTIMVRCDTVFLLNKSTFSRFNAVYKDPKINELVSTQNQLIEAYEKRNTEQDDAYEQLKSNFDKVVNNSNLLIQTSKEELGGIKQSLSSAQTNIDSAKTDISEVKDLLKKDLRKANEAKLKWGIGGLAIGILVMLLGGSG